MILARFSQITVQHKARQAFTSSKPSEKIRRALNNVLTSGDTK